MIHQVSWQQRLASGAQLPAQILRYPSPVKGGVVAEFVLPTDLKGGGRVHALHANTLGRVVRRAVIHPRGHLPVSNINPTYAVADTRPSLMGCPIRRLLSGRRPKPAVNRGALLGPCRVGPNPQRGLHVYLLTSLTAISGEH